MRQRIKSPPDGKTHSPRPAGARLTSLHIAMATSGTGVTLPSLRPEAARKGFEALIIIPFPHTAELRPPLNLLTAVEHKAVRFL